MPCYDSRDSQGAMQSRLNDATAVACEACKLLEQLKLVDDLSPRAQAWLEEHKKLDAEHEALEEKKKALAQERARRLEMDYYTNPPKRGTCLGIAAGCPACHAQCFTCYRHDKGF